jgi:hypothetical protein
MLPNAQVLHTKRNVLTFPTNALADSLERFLGQVQNGPGQALRAPIKLDWGGPLGGAVQGIQVIATWAQAPEANRTLRLAGAFAKIEATRERFASTLPGMAAIYFAKAIECDGQTFSRFQALGYVGRRVQAMQSSDYLETLRGPGVALCCFGGAKNEFLRALYARPEPGQVRSLADFRVLLPRLLSASGESAGTALKKGQGDYLSALIHQLFLNADEHGSHSAQGLRLDEMMRGIVLRVTPVSQATAFVRASAKDTPLRTYISKLAFTAPKTEASMTRPLWLVELSVFDTGPGLALRWLADKEDVKGPSEMSSEQELAAVRTCFEKHATTKDSMYLGQGLPVALGAMRNLRAFMTLRTGRYSLYQDFSRGDTSEFRPKHRFADKPVLPRIAGTAYSITFLAK